MFGIFYDSLNDRKSDRTAAPETRPPPTAIIERGTPPSEKDMDLFVVRTRLQQLEGDPAAADEATRLRAYLDRHR